MVVVSFERALEAWLFGGYSTSMQAGEDQSQRALGRAGSGAADPPQAAQSAKGGGAKGITKQAAKYPFKSDVGTNHVLVEGTNGNGGLWLNAADLPEEIRFVFAGRVTRTAAQGALFVCAWAGHNFYVSSGEWGDARGDFLPAWMVRPKPKEKEPKVKAANSPNSKPTN